MSTYLQYNNHMILHQTDRSKYFYGIVEDPIILPNRTIRVEFSQGYVPTQGLSREQVSSNPNVWDITVNMDGFMQLFRHNEYLLKILACNTYAPGGYYENMFTQMCYDCPNLTKVPMFNLSNASNCVGMFSGCENLTYLPEFSFNRSTQYGWTDLELSSFCSWTKISSVNFSNCRPKYADNMFIGCSELLAAPNIDLSLCTNIYSMFDECTKMTTSPDYDIHSANDISYMYFNCSSLNTIPDLTVSPNMTKCRLAFAGCRNASGGILRMYNKLKDISTITDHQGCFLNCGVDSQTGAAELSQIPSDWKGEPE